MGEVYRARDTKLDRDVAIKHAGWWLKPSPPQLVTRFVVVPPQGEFLSTSPVLSPDGRRLAYVANSRVYVHSFDQLDPVPVAGGDHLPQPPRNPVFSPDSQWVVFWEAGTIKKVSVNGGGATTLCPFQSPPSGATWSRDGYILLGYGDLGIWRVSENGGPPEQVIRVDKAQRAHRPQLLPDGRRILFTLAQSASWDEAQIVVQSLDTGVRTTIIEGGADARYLPSGHLLFAFRDAVRAVRFDAASLRTSGTPVPVVDGVGRPLGPTNQYSQFTAAPDGTFAYVPASGVPAARRRLVWVDRLGHEEPIAAAEPRGYHFPRLSPDGTRIALEIQDENQSFDIWVWDLVRVHSIESRRIRRRIGNQSGRTMASA